MLLVTYLRKLRRLIVERQLPYVRSSSSFALLAKSKPIRLQHPFDTIKVRLQTQGRNGRFSGPLNCLSETIRNEGVLAMYKGITPPLLTIGVVNSIMFGLQGITVGKITGKRTVSFVRIRLPVFRAFSPIANLLTVSNQPVFSQRIPRGRHSSARSAEQR
jgi:hypothetical protein